MSKKRVSAKEAAAAIRAGMDDTALMERYNLSSDGLQSLIDKLVHAGFVDLGEIENRLPGIFGAVTVSESAINLTGGGAGNGAERSGNQSSPLVNAQEAAGEIRLGMNDNQLMEKYRLTFKGLQSLFSKLMAAKLITQADLVRRIDLDADHTVDLREQKLSFKDALQELGLGEGKSSSAEIEETAEHTVAIQPLKRLALPETTVPKKNDRENTGYNVQEATQDAGQFEPAWYNKSIILALLLIGIFPIGFYGLFRNVTLSHRVKAVILLAWVGLATACSLLLSQMI
jgi:hypothetical protein